MFLIRLFRFLSGYVVFSGKGGFPERFINLCSMNGISLWDAKSSSGTLHAKTSIKGYKRLRPCAKKSGMKIRIAEKCGLPFILAPYIRRKGLFAGIVISAVITALLSSTVWTVEVLGNERFTQEQIIAIAEHYGVRTGAFRHTLNLKDIRTSIKGEVDGISWFSVVVDGSHVVLHVSETEGSTEIIDSTKPCNIVSGIDGEVLRIETQQGTAAVLPGNAVTKGDLLISGVTEKPDGSVSFAHARGTAIIRTKYTHEATLPATINIQKPTEIKQTFTLSIFGLEIPLFFRQSVECIRQDRQFLSYKGTVLPIGIISNTYAQHISEDIILTQPQSSLLSSFLAFTSEKEIMKDAAPETKTVNINRNDNGTQIVTEHIVHKKTGIENYFEVTESNN